MRDKDVMDRILFALIASSLMMTALAAGCIVVAIGGWPMLCAALGSCCSVAAMLLLYKRSSRRERLGEASEDAKRPEPVTLHELLVEEDTTELLALEEDAAALPASGDDTIVLPAPPEEDDTIVLEADDAPVVDQTPAPVTPTVPTRISKLDFRRLSHELTSTDDPITRLRLFVADIRQREDAASELEGQAPPCGLELYAARMLEEAGLFANDVKVPDIEVVRTRRSRMVYLRCLEERIPYLAKCRILELEGALNAIRFACASLPADAMMEEAYVLNQGLARSIVAQAASIDEPMDLEDVGEWPEGEWTVRYGISRAAETLQLPHRLQLRFRTNVSDGNVAMEIDLTPADVFAKSCVVDDLGIVPTTGDMRQKAAADYALRLALLMAASAFRCSGRIRHVWVAAVQETATRRMCYLSVDFDRWRFSRIDLSDIQDLEETYRAFAPVMRLEDGWLRPVKQGFHLGEERFCPMRRYQSVSLSSRRLEGHLADALGTDHVSGLSIEEADGRAFVANAIMMQLAPAEQEDATRRNVSTVLRLAGDDPDPTVRTAAERVVRAMVDGRLGEDAHEVGEEFVRGDALTRANDRAKDLMAQQRPAEALEVIAPVLSQLDDAGVYDDSDHVDFRYYNSYVERALSNRHREALGAGKTIMLVPDAYYEAHLLVSVCALMGGDPERALRHAQRLVTLAPYDLRSHLHEARCLEVLGRDDEATERLRSLLERAYDPQGVAIAYYRMAFFQWKAGHPACAQACYEMAMRYMPQTVPTIAMQISLLQLQHGAELMDSPSDEQIEEQLRMHDIPLAPTEETSALFYDCARASLDAEIFPVALNFARVMAAFPADDVIAGVIRSLEDEPDRL